MRLRTTLLLFAATGALAAPAVAAKAGERETAADSTEESAEEAAAPQAGDASAAKPPVEIFSTGMAKGRDRLDSATSTSALKGDDIQRFGPRPLSEVLRTMAGLRVASGIGEGNNNYTVRGLPLAAGGSKYMQFQEDGLPVLEFGDIFNVSTDVFLRNDFTVSAIETIRGGSASTFASNSPGGIVNVISRTGTETGFRAQLTAGLDFDSKRLDFDYGAKLGENTRFYVGGFYRSGEGPRDIGITGWQGGQIKANITREFAGGYVRAYLKYLDDRSPTYAPYFVNITGTDDKPVYRNFPGFDLRDDAVLSPNLGPIITLDRNNNPAAYPINTGQSVKSKSLGIEAQFDVAGWTITEKARYAVNGGDFSRTFPNRADTVANFAASIGGAGATARYASGPLTGQLVPTDANGNGLLALYFTSFNRASSLDNFTNDLRATRVWNVGGGKLTTTAGLYYAAQDISSTWLHTSQVIDVAGGGRTAMVDIFNSAGVAQTQNGYFAYGRGNSGQFRRIFDVGYDVLAPYGSINWHVGKLAIGGSLRYDTGKVRGQLFGADLGGGRVGLGSFDIDRNGTISRAEQRVAFLPLDRPAPVDYDYSYLSYSVGVNYRFAEPFSVFARYSRGHRAAADKVLFTPAVSSVTGAVVNPGDKDDTVIQYEGGFKFRKNGVTVNATAFHVEAEDQNVLNGAAASTNRVYEADGVELEGTFTRGVFSLTASATYTQAKITEDRIGGVFTGKEPRHQPDWVLVAVPQLDFGKVALGANIVTITGSYAQDVNQLRMPGFTQVGAFLEVQPAEHLRLTVSAQNLFDTLGIYEVNQATVPANGIGFARAANGRTVQASLALSF
ncbi:TonB-dependent receptor domain-containing protein [Erythrobacter sp. NE805]|uniref:TonB-dependent receptor domain-containing protein n=1 Tax=Erythrobacter sp. NE805 TaxID=3389875 RepID=UPI00396AF766